MASFTGEDIIKATEGVVLSGTVETRVRGIATDSRCLRKGNIFVALKGETFDGHHYIKDALQQGAKGVIVEESKGTQVLSVVRRWSSARKGESPLVLGVKETTRAYQDIAAYHRRRFSIPVVAITGSNGKTTTKEMVARVLNERWKTLKTEGNANNRLGVPQTLLRLTRHHQVAVVEMGVDAEGQTTRLCEIAHPTHGVITNIGPDHLEFFGSLEGSARAKAELLSCLPNDGAIILNADDRFYEYLRKQARCPSISFGMSSHADIRGTHMQRQQSRMVVWVSLYGRPSSHRVMLNVQGRHNVSNALAAIAVGKALGLSMEKMKAGLAKFRPISMRSRIKSCKGLTIIEDCYNANPASMKAAIALLEEAGRERQTIAVLGDMLELGKEERAWHRDVGRFIATQHVSYLIACGKLGEDIARGAQEGGMPASSVYYKESVTQAAEVLRHISKPGDVVLLKASRGMKLENILDEIS